MVLLEILQANLKMQLTGTGDNVLARLLHLDLWGAGDIEGHR